MLVFDFSEKQKCYLFKTEWSRNFDDTYKSDQESGILLQIIVHLRHFT